MPTRRIPGFSMPLPEWARLPLFVGGYLALEWGYVRIPNAVLAEVVYGQGIARVCAGLINLAAPEEAAAAVRNHLLSPRADLEIVRGCDGAAALFLLAAAILACPAAPRRKLWGLAGAVGLVYALNLARVCGLYFIMARHPGWFEPAHIYLAPTFMVAVGCLYFAGWAARAPDGADAPQ